MIALLVGGALPDAGSLRVPSPVPARVVLGPIGPPAAVAVPPLDVVANPVRPEARVPALECVAKNNEAKPRAKPRPLLETVAWVRAHQYL